MFYIDLEWILWNYIYDCRKIWFVFDYVKFWRQDIYIYIYIYVYIYMISTTSLLVAGAADKADILCGPEIAVAMEEVSNITYIIIV